ncbi:MAG: helix-turn-helix domain-containing protein [Chryseolinea sp.]
MKPEQTGLPHHYSFIPNSIVKRMVKHPLCSKLFVTEIGHEADTLFHPFTKNKLNNLYLLVYVTKGEGWYQAKTARFRIRENEFFVLPASHIKDLGSEENNPWSIYWAYFAGTQAGNVATHLNGKSNAPREAKALVGRIAQFNDILHHLELMENIENLVYANSRFYSFLCSFRLMVLSASKHAKKDGVIQSIEYMRERINSPVTLADLAAVAGLSVSHYCAVFKQKTMQTPLQLYTSMKIQRACQLLQNRNQTIKSIAYTLGFFDQYHFSKVFKSIMGMAPRDFRKKTSVT